MLHNELLSLSFYDYCLFVSYTFILRIEIHFIFPYSLPNRFHDEKGNILDIPKVIHGHSPSLQVRNLLLLSIFCDMKSVLDRRIETIFYTDQFSFLFVRPLE